MKLKDYWPRCLQDLVEFQQIANAEQPEFETALDDVRTAADDFFLATLGNDLSPRTPATRTTRAMSTRTAV